MHLSEQVARNLFSRGVDADPEIIALKDWIIHSGRRHQNFKYLITDAAEGACATTMTWLIDDTGDRFISNRVYGYRIRSAPRFGLHQVSVWIVLDEIDRNPQYAGDVRFTLSESTNSGLIRRGSTVRTYRVPAQQT